MLLASVLLDVTVQQRVYSIYSHCIHFMYRKQLIMSSNNQSQVVGDRKIAYIQGPSIQSFPIKFTHGGESHFRVVRRVHPKQQFKRQNLYMYVQRECVVLQIIQYVQRVPVCPVISPKSETGTMIQYFKHREEGICSY